VSSLAYEVSAKGRDVGEVAKEFVEKNSDRVDGWLGL
ncbi:MAG: glycine/betaine ABC transporter substrate-binding protein, partial [Pseudomonadota bacterium]